MNRVLYGIRPEFLYLIQMNCRSQWPRGLRRRSAAARLLRLWVRIPPGAWMSVVSTVCCQVEVSATSWSLVQRSSTDCDASLCVIYKPQEWGGHDLRWVAAPQQKKNYIYIYTHTHIHAHTYIPVMADYMNDWVTEVALMYSADH